MTTGRVRKTQPSVIPASRKSESVYKKWASSPPRATRPWSSRATRDRTRPQNSRSTCSTTDRQTARWWSCLTASLMTRWRSPWGKCHFCFLFNLSLHPTYGCSLPPEPSQYLSVGPPIWSKTSNALDFLRSRPTTDSELPQWSPIFSSESRRNFDYPRNSTWLPCLSTLSDGFAWHLLTATSSSLCVIKK